MGLADVQARKLFQTQYISDLEFGMNMIAQKRSTLAYQATAAAEQYPELAAQLHLMDKKLETEMKTLETQYKIANSEMDSLNKMIENNVKDYKYA